MKVETKTPYSADWSERVHVGLFLIVLLGVGLLSLTKIGSYQAQVEGSFIKGEATDQFETLYDKALPIRSLGMNLWALIQYKLLNEGNPGVIIGHNDWLFSDEEFYAPEAAKDYLKANLATIDAVDAYLESLHIPLIVVSVPAKAAIYEEQITPQARPSPFMQTLYQNSATLLSDVTQQLVNLTPLYQERDKTEALLYFRTDTHWTPTGAQLAAEAVANSVAQLNLELQKTAFTTELVNVEHFHGDLTNFLPLTPWFSDHLPPQDHYNHYETITRASDNDASLDLFSSDHIPVTLVGTSYSANKQWHFLGALKQALNADILNMAAEGQGPIQPMLDYLTSEAFLDAPPELIVWELPTRYLPTEATRADYINQQLVIEPLSPQ